MVVAKISKFIVVCVGLLMTPAVLRFAFEPSMVSGLWLVLSGAVVWRVNQIAVYVNDGWVIIRNFFRTTHVPVWEAEVELGEKEGGFAFSDAGGPYDQGGQTLYIRRQWHGDMVHVGVAPRYGKEAVRIRLDLESEIQKARAAA